MAGKGSGSIKSRLYAELGVEIDKVNQKLERAEKLAKSAGQHIKDVLKEHKENVTGKGDKGAASSMDFKPPAAKDSSYQQTPGNKGYDKNLKETDLGYVKVPGQDGASSMAFKDFGKNVAYATGARMLSAYKTDDYLYNDISQHRFGFYNGTTGNAAGSKFAEKMMGTNAGVSAMDAINAMNYGNSIGLMSGMQQKNGVYNSVTGLADITGAGYEAGMGATAALQQGSSVNKLRMIGIQVRNSQGYPRAVEDIARDLYKMLDRSKTGKGKLTSKDLDLSLLPGNSLDMLLNQYFNGDPVLRQGIVNYLYEFVTGNSPVAGVEGSVGSRNAEIYRGKNASTPAGVAGFQFGNDINTGLGNFKNFLQNVPVIGEIFSAVNFLVTGGGTVAGAGKGDGPGIPNNGASAGGRGGDNGWNIPQGWAAPLNNGMNITSRFNETRNLVIKGKHIKTQPHRGMDFSAAEGTEIHALRGGTVVTNDYSSELGNYAIIQHDDGYQSVYAHMKSPTHLQGSINAGDLVGQVGMTGMATGPHLHLAIQDKSGKVYDPEKYFAGQLPGEDVNDGSSSTTSTQTSSSTSSSSSSSKSSSNDSISHSLFNTTGQTSLFSRSIVGSGDGPGIPNSGASSGRGVVVNINLPAGSSINEQMLAREVKRILDEDVRVKGVVSR
jgi:murein DD-endopeptidase MepM/ murein hydrolase activator NlpD